MRHPLDIHNNAHINNSEASLYVDITIKYKKQIHRNYIPRHNDCMHVGIHT